MKPVTALLGSLAAAIVTALVIIVPDWHLPVKGEQLGPDGTSMVQFANTSPWRVAAPPSTVEPATAEDASLAAAGFKNIKVLTDVAPAEFVQLQHAMTAWVSPNQGCGFCHTGTNYAADDNPMKNVTRDMLRLTRYLNTTWHGHNGASGVTCFTCHHAEPVPPETWFPSQPKAPSGVMEPGENWNETAQTVRHFFPDNGWSEYFLHDEPIRAQSTTALRSNTVASQIDVKRVYEMMMQMSDGIGVNCGYCHNSRAFADWSQSTPNRWVGYDAIRMVRDINLTYLLHLRDELPQTRQVLDLNRGATPIRARDPSPATGLTVCVTCHYGHIKPDPGAATIANYPALASPVNAQPAWPVATASPTASN